MRVGVGRGIHEVDGVGHAVFHRELHRVEVVAEGAAERQRVFRHPLDERRRVLRRVLHVALVERRPRVVGHHVHLLLADHVAAEVLVELHRRLQGHAERARLVVGGEELLARLHLEDVAPATAVERLEEGGEADVLEHLIPVERIHQVPHRLVGRARRMFLVRQHHRVRHRHAQPLAERVVEELVVGARPERVADDVGAVEGRRLEPGPVERDVVRDAVDDDTVGARPLHFHAADLDELGGDPGDAHGVDALDERAGKDIFHAEQDADGGHGGYSGGLSLSAAGYWANACNGRATGRPPRGGMRDGGHFCR